MQKWFTFYTVLVQFHLGKTFIQHYKVYPEEAVVLNLRNKEGVY